MDQAAATVIERARKSGKCPPSLLADMTSRVVAEADGFEANVVHVMDANRFFLKSDLQADDFISLLQKAESLTKIPVPTDDMKKVVLEQRRCIILGLVGSTPSASPSIERILASGYLDYVKVWLDDILSGKAGGMDLLLQLLSNIVDLPVNKAHVKQSGMGKLIGNVEKNSMVKDTPNEAAVKERVQKVKDAWYASVKARKSQDAAAAAAAAAAAKKDDTKPSAGSKRELSSQSNGSPKSVKRVKTDDDKNSSLSSLLKRVSGTKNNGSKPDSADSPAVPMKTTPEKSQSQAAGAVAKKKKSANRVKWADHFGGELSASQLYEGENASAVAELTDTSVSWTDRKKRDRAREKELLSKMKKSKLLDDDDEDDGMLPLPKQTQPTVTWREPSLLPERPDVTKAQLESKEVSTQVERMKTVTLASYFSDAEVPPSPAPISDIEQAIDMTSQSSAVVASIPFFIPTQQPPEPAPAPQPASVYPNTSQFAPSAPGAVGHSSSSTGATPDFVQSLGLPMFLVGQDVQALQTLANSPGLLGTLVDSSGMYDQQRLMSLVQTLSGPQGGPGQQQGAQSSGYSTSGSAYAPAPSSYRPTSSMPSSFPPSGGFRTKSDEGNLHVSGYGASTTQADIINLFSPYVQVDEVVMKGTFSFINTSDPVNAQRAREALHGTLLGGMPIRINAATRKNKDSSGGFGGSQSFSAYGPAGAAQSFPGSNFRSGAARPPPVANNSFGGAQGGAQIPGGPRAPPGPPPPPAPGQGNVANMDIPIDAVRDDRGNAATKNLFVAGYGAGTTEEQLRDIFGQHCNVVGVIIKGNFSFVNTATRGDAVMSRRMLQGTSVNGGPLRINFAKETGRLGTSFDLTYNERSGPNARRFAGAGAGPPPPPPMQGVPPNQNSQQSMSYYGRGY